jgi:hypothetical protein
MTMEDARELRKKADRWRMLAHSLSCQDDRHSIEMLVAELERQANALSAGEALAAARARA